jgi:hypothetical protein
MWRSLVVLGLAPLLAARTGYAEPASAPPPSAAPAAPEAVGAEPADPAVPGTPAAEATTPAPAEPTTAPEAATDTAPEGGVLTDGEPLHEDQDFGPVIMVEAIEITGNTATGTELIRRALPVEVGDVLHASDPRLRQVRFKLLALGYFREVTLAMRRGGARGQVILAIHVEERGTVVLNRLWFGSSTLTPWWLGADVGERNLLGTGLAIGGAAIYAPHGDVEGSRDQWAGELRLAAPNLRGSRWGASGSLTWVHGSEAYRIADGEATSSQRAFGYRRVGGRAGFSYDLSALSRLSGGVRAELIDATLPVAPTRTLADGRVVAVDLQLEPGRSRVATASLAFDRDTRPDPVLPHAGDHLAFAAEVGASALGGSYDFATMFGRYERWWPLRDDRDAIALRLVGGLVIGDAPRFDLIHVADVDRMLTPRALGMVLSSAAPFSLLGTRADKPTYGAVGSSATVEYSLRLFRGSGARQVYGGDLFLGAGVWALAEADALKTRDTSLWRALPVDLFVDAGLRLDTDIGTFELTIANALGRLPR